TVQITDVETSYYDLFCGKFTTCDNAPFFNIIIGDKEDCLAFMEEMSSSESGGLPDILDAVDEGTIIYDGQAAHECLVEMEALDCDAFENVEPEACRAVFTGTIALGESCTLDEECVSSFCDTEDSCPGTCAEPVLQGNGCDYSSECEPGTECVLGECIAFTNALTEGEKCDPDEDWCAEALYCNSDSDECEAYLALGDECEGENDLECGPDALCFEGADAAVCIEITTLVETEGEICDHSQGILCAYYAGLTCAYDDFDNMSGTCVPIAQAGDLCFISGENMTMIGCDYFGDSYCDLTNGYQEDAYCVLKKEAGEICGEDQECLSEWCDNGTCAPEEQCK
ncbi:MAG: hypothetical protein ACQES9_05660, partial [Myxococcota bacterium]